MPTDNSESYLLFIKPYSLKYNIDLDIHIVHIDIHNFADNDGTMSYQDDFQDFLFIYLQKMLLYLSQIL